MTTSNKTLVVYAEFPENVRFFLVPSDHPQIAELRTVAGQTVNTVDCRDEAVEVICNAFCAEAEAGQTGWASEFEVKADLVHHCSEAFMVGFIL